MLEVIRKHPLYYGLACLILGIALTWLFLRALHPNPVSLLVAVALSKDECKAINWEDSYFGIETKGNEMRCFFKDQGVFGRIRSAHIGHY